MKTERYRLLSALFVVGLAVGLPSCKEDEPPVPPKLSFEKEALDVKESDGEVEIKLILDKAASQDIEIKYKISGTAAEKRAAGTNAAFDYEITSDYLETEIEAGETEGVIKLTFYSDLSIENDETIEISIDEVDEGIELTRDDEININLLQEDGMVILLEWPAETANGRADMDLLVRAGANTTTWDGVLTGSADGSFTGPEGAFLPFALEFAAYGLSYIYYDGTLEPLQFTVTFANFVNGDFEPEASHKVFNGTYSLQNINKWTQETVSTTQVVQTFLKADGKFGSFSNNITIPTSGSRLSLGSKILDGATLKGSKFK
jgi:hypothetical protein